MKRIILLFLLSFTFNFSFTNAQSVSNSTIYFDSDVYQLDELSISTLEDLHSELATFKESHIKIVGHTDQDGSNEYNVALSKKRAEEVKAFFTNNGFAGTEIELSFHGESDLVYNDLDAVSKQKNRRVTIISEGYNYETVTELVNQVVPNDIEQVTVDANIESSIMLNKGTEVTIPEHAFCHLDGTPIESGMVELTFKEAFEFLDMVDERLFTQTQDQLLETAGMIYIDASSNGVPLKLREGKQIELLFPEQDLKDGMELFTGREDENGIIWEETGEDIVSVKQKEDRAPIKVDLSRLLDFQFGEQESANLDFSEMIPYPHPAKKAYMPYKGNYTEEGYVEALKKYNKVKAAYEKDLIDRPEQLEWWENEVTFRKLALFQHKKNVVQQKVRAKVEESIARLRDKMDEIDHERLVNVLFAFLDSEAGRVQYDDIEFKRKVFGKGLGDVIKYEGLTMPAFEYSNNSMFCRDFYNELRVVKNIIEDEKIGLGIVDSKNLNRYLTRTSNLGWINCDRFIQLNKNQMTTFEFANHFEGSQFYLIFKDIKSMIRPYYGDGKISFSGVPKGEEVRLVAVNMKDGNALVAQQELTLGTNEKVQLSFANAELKDIRKAFSNI